MLRLLLDTNVLVAAAGFPGSAPATLVDYAGRGLCEVIVTDPLLQEAQRAFSEEFGRAEGLAGYRLLARMPHKRVLWPFEWEHLESEVKARVRDRGDVPHVCAFRVAKGHLFVTLDDKLVRMGLGDWVVFATPAEALRAIRRDVAGARQ